MSAPTVHAGDRIRYVKSASEVYNGKVISQAGDGSVTFTHTNPSGCDSKVTVQHKTNQVTVAPPPYWETDAGL